jgi:hypothetical protein
MFANHPIGPKLKGCHMVLVGAVRNPSAIWIFDHQNEVIADFQPLKRQSVVCREKAGRSSLMAGRSQYEPESQSAAAPIHHRGIAR